MSKRYSLRIICAYTGKQKELFASDMYSEVFNKYNILRMYRRNLPARENTRWNRKNVDNVNRKLSKIFNRHINFITTDKHWYDVLAIKDNQTGLYFSYYRFFQLNSGCVPNDYATNISYREECKQVYKELAATWQNRAFNNTPLKYHNTNVEYKHVK